MPLFVDAETYSECPITSGTPRYATDPSTEVLLIAYAIDNGPVQVLDLVADPVVPHEFMEALDTQPVVIHNSFFDRSVLREVCGWDIPCERICDTMVQALAHGLPGALDKLCDVFGLSQDLAKQKDGKQLIHVFCKPLRGKRILPADRPEQWLRFKEYAKQDVVAMRELHRLLPKWNYPGTRFAQGEPSAEHRLWCLDQRVNDRGFACDVELASAAVQAAKDTKDMLNTATALATDGAVGAATQRDALLGYILAEHGVGLPDMQADTLKRRLEDPSLPREVKHLLDLRLQSSRNSSSKYSAVMKAVSFDNRLRGALQFAGAATTGRWSGRIFQPQNLMRPTMEHDDIEQGIADITAGVAHLAYNNLPEVMGNAVRGVLVAPPGRKLVCADLSAIEARVLPWLAEDESIVQFFRDFDAGRIVYDSYMLTYANLFGGRPEDVTKAQRQISKTADLSTGYGGGVAAFLTFAATYNLDLDALADTIWSIADPAHINECADKWLWAKDHGYNAGMGKHKYAAFEYVKQKWRAARVPTTELWAELGDAFRYCVLYAGETQSIRGGKLKMRRDGDWMRLRLPSGRSVCFLKPQVKDGQMTYLGLDRYTRKWSRVPTHGGKLAGIATQATARDLLGEAMPRAEQEGYEIVLTVHDEMICETPDSGDYTANRLEQIMTQGTDWSVGLPLAAHGFETYRYRKD